MQWYLKVLRQYVDFNGRARRTEFWMFTLFSVIISIVLGVVDYLLNTSVLGMIYSLAVLLPTLAVGARRLHDIGRSGWWQLIGIIPIIGWIILIVWDATDGHPQPNQWGANPNALAGPAVAY
jgi:uncharacterized membrane protein YhaH (DUF805 family)